MALKNGIVVKFYQDFSSHAQETSKSGLHIKSYEKTFSAEQLIILACKERRIGPSGVYIFGLSEEGNGDRWILPNQKILCSTDRLQEFTLRIRFIPSLTGLNVLGRECKEAFNYFFLQCRHDFVKEKFT